MKASRVRGCPGRRAATLATPGAGVNAPANGPYRPPGALEEAGTGEV
jgi:hypothetical protein